MATPDSVEFNSEAVVAFITENGGKATTAEVARHFRKYLVDEENQEKNKALFREYVNAVAVIKRVENEKVLVLKAGFEKNEPNRTSDSVQSTALRSLGSSIESIPTEDSRSLQEVIQKENRLPSGSSTESTDRSSDSSARNKDCIETLKEMEYAEMNDHHIVTPVAPPRRKHSMKEKKSVTQSEEVDSAKVANAGGDKESEPKISVKEQAQKINKFVSESQLVLRPHNANLKKPSREMAFDKNADDDDRASVISVNPSTKEWMVVAAKADYHAMIKLLRDEPKLAKYKDFISTALHWAAKHGNAEVVKLIAGTHGANINIRSGYTPLHLAAMFQRKAVYDLLVSTYHADQSVQDYNGRTAKEYLQHKHVSSSSSSKSESNRPSRRSSSRRNSDSEEQLDKPLGIWSWLQIASSGSNQADTTPVWYTATPTDSSVEFMQSDENEDEMYKEAGFLRLGSFNVKVRKTADSVSGKSKPSSKLHKGWGSADNLSAKMVDKALMPPPSKTVPLHKCQKHRKSHISTT